MEYKLNVNSIENLFLLHFVVVALKPQLYPIFLILFFVNYNQLKVNYNQFKIHIKILIKFFHNLVEKRYFFPLYCILRIFFSSDKIEVTSTTLTLCIQTMELSCIKCTCVISFIWLTIEENKKTVGKCVLRKY